LPYADAQGTTCWCVHPQRQNHKNSKHSSLHISSLHSKKVVVGLDLFLVRRLGHDIAMDLAVLHSFRLGEQMLMVRMLVAWLGHLVDLQILGETHFPVEHVEILGLVVWDN